jgi:hypothetical protein
MRPITIMAIVAASLAATHVTAEPALESEPERALRDVEGSHIAGNVPPPALFDRLLQRDLQTYFGRRGITKPVIRYVLLREAPTQSGTAYPKYYLWVWVWSAAQPATSGAVRVAAVARRSFDVTDFVSREAVLSDVDRLPAVFPSALVDAIRRRAASGAFPSR